MGPHHAQDVTLACVGIQHIYHIGWLIFTEDGRIGLGVAFRTENMS